MFEQLRLIRSALIRIVVLFLACSLVFFLVPTTIVSLYGVSVLIPTDSGHTVAERIILTIQDDLVPKGAQVVTSNPLDPFTTQATIAIVLSLMLMFPYFLLEFFLFVRAGLYSRERRVLFRVLIFSLLLFGSGAFFAYTVVIPLVFGALFTYLPNNIVPFYNIRELISLVVGLVFAISLVFLLPICMVLLTQGKLVPPLFWRAYARHAILMALVLSAIITPDGSGVSMMLLALPICLLYGMGYIGSVLVSCTSSVDNH